MRRIVVNIYEGKALVVGHTFYGSTVREAKEVLHAHLQTDSFFRAAIKKGRWKGIDLSYTSEIY